MVEELARPEDSRANHCGLCLYTGPSSVACGGVYTTHRKTATGERTKEGVPAGILQTEMLYIHLDSDPLENIL